MFKRPYLRFLTHIDEQSDVNLKNALKLALSSIIVRVSNQESDTRYAAIDNNYTANDVLESFLTACNKIHEAKKRNSVNLECSKIFNQDILSVLASDFDKPVGLVITSPPYPNAYEYWLYHKYRMWWLGFDPIKLELFESGARPHYQKKRTDRLKKISKTNEQRFLICSLMFCFLVDMFVLLLGVPQLKGKIVDNAELIRNVAENHKNGYSLQILNEKLPQTKNPST